MRTLFVVMPVFNEPRTLATSVARVRAADVGAGWRVQVVLIDDGSTDATPDAVRALGAEGSAITLFHPRNRGKGAAIRTGFAHALTLASDDDAIMIQDADLEYDPADFRGMLGRLETGRTDVVLGNRWAVPPKGLKRLAHRMLNGFLTLSSNLMTGLRVSDMECCLKLFTVPAMRRIIGDLDEERFGIEPQIVAAAARHRLRVEESPVSYAPRSFDEGKKIRMKDGLRVFVVLWRERRRTARAVHSAA
ncbi:MAG: glycosyltransferase family 2 protein [Phycisphaerales bacterium]|jgi:glycosyltransferase involved in cell wall biosynthesis